MSEEKEPEVVSEGYLPCGCYQTKYDDGKVRVSQCPPHGLMETARLLVQAGNHLGGVGETLLAAQREQLERQADADLGAAASEAAKGPKLVDD